MISMICCWPTCDAHPQYSFTGNFGSGGDSYVLKDLCIYTLRKTYVKKKLTVWMGTSEAQSLSPDKNRLAIARALSVKHRRVKKKINEFRVLKHSELSNVEQ